MKTVHNFHHPSEPSKVSKVSKKALIVIDIQNDYFPDGKYPLWNTSGTLENIKRLIARAKASEIPIVLIKHVSSAPKGTAPFFEQGSEGVEIHPDVIKHTSNAPIIEKQYADSFYQTELEAQLQEWNIDELLICGMMTQNCVTHTAISKQAEKYKVSIVSDCCTTTDQMLHNIALNAVSTRLSLVDISQVFSEEGIV